MLKRAKGLRLLMVVLLALLSVGVTQAADTIKLAATEPLSGNFKDIGERYLAGVEYGVQKINEQGGLLGKKVELIAVDSELKPDVATRKATNLILKDNVKYFCGGTGSSVGGAMSVLCEKNNALFFSYGMDAASLTGDKCSRNFFRTACNTDTHSFALAKWVADKGFKKVCTIAQDYSFGKEATAAFITKLKELAPSAAIVAELYHPLGEKDFAPYVTQIIASGADIIFTPNWGNDLSLLLKQGYQLGLKTKFACYYLNDETAISAVGNDPAVVGSMASEIYMLTIPTEANKKFVAEYHKDKGGYPAWLIGKGYMAVMFWAEAVKKAGKDDVNAVITAWEGLKYNGPAGEWIMRPCDHQAQVPIWMAEIVAKSEFFPHAFEGPAWAMPAKDVEVPCDQTGCTKIKAK
ncbi:MAG TPA: ABC transporter substrate-binding protein [Terriglobia bacterium]|nr:ABC transporter substrate-binding protein [Terriglobia bacterium]